MAKRTGPDQWQAANREIIDRLDLRSAYRDLGIDITGNEPNGGGWLECRAFGQVDNSPSAGINVGGEHPSKGRYKEFTGDGVNLSLFEFAVRAGRFGKWTEARDHFAAVAGVKLPGVKAPRHPEDSLEFRDYNVALVNSWCLKKTGICEAAVKLAGGQIASDGKFVCLTLPIFGEHGTNDDPCGWVAWNITGKPLEIWQGKGIPPKSAKMKTISGSRAGWMGQRGIEHLATAEVVWVTEGPSDLLGLMTAIVEQSPGGIGRHAVVCNSAGAMERNEIESVAMFAGKTVFVVPDCDQPGQVGCRRRAESIAEVAGAVRLVRLPFQITDNHGKDLRDYLTGGATFADLEQLASLGELIRRKEPLPSLADPPANGEQQPKQPPSSDKAATFQEQQILEQIGVDVLGEMQGGRIKVFSEFHRKTDVIPDISKLTYHRLVQIGGPKVKAAVHESNEEIPGMVPFKVVKESIALLAGYRRVEDSESGVGCWQGIDEDGETTTAIILVGAGEAAVRNGQPGLKKISKPRYGGRLLDISSSTEWYDYAELNQLVLACDPQEAADTIADLENLFARWRWSHQGQAPKVLAGLVIATWVQTLWVWRPQVSITGKSNAGKTTLFKALEGLFGSLAITSSGSTAAGIRQAIAKSGAVPLLDEFESGRHRAEILEMLRASGRGDRVLRGTSSHKGQEFTLRHIAWVAGIESGLKREPDKNRFVRQELIRPPSNEMGRLNLPPADELRKLGQRSLAVALRVVLQAKEMASALRVLRFEGVDSRLIECYAVPAACYAAAAGEAEVGPASEVLGRMLHTVEQAEMIDDAMQLLEEILQAEIIGERGQRATVAQVVSRKDMDPTRMEDCERMGVGVVCHKNEDGFFVSHRQVAAKLLKGTQWEQQNIDEILKRVDGAQKVKKRIAGMQPWGVFIPMKALERLGVGPSQNSVDHLLD